MPAPLNGYYLNLDRSPERDAWMRAQLARLGMDWVQRRPAIDGAHVSMPPACTQLPGAYGCALSHLAVLEQAPAGSITLVLEDDTELSDQLPDVLRTALSGPTLDALDMVFLECQPHCSLSHVSTMWDVVNKKLPPGQPGGARRIRGVELLNASVFYKWGCPAYLVTPHGRDRLLALMREWLREGPARPLDRNMENALAGGQLRGAITVPFLATTGLQWHGQSTIGNGSRMPSNAFMVLRRLLYAGSIAEVADMARHTAPLQADPVLDMLTPVLKEIAAVQRNEILSNKSGFYL